MGSVSISPDKTSGARFSIEPDVRSQVAKISSGSRMASVVSTPSLDEKLRSSNSDRALEISTCKLVSPNINETRKQVQAIMDKLKLRPVIDTVFDWKDVVKAHQYMEANRTTHLYR